MKKSRWSQEKGETERGRGERGKGERAGGKEGGGVRRSEEQQEEEIIRRRREERGVDKKKYREGELRVLDEGRSGLVWSGLVYTRYPYPYPGGWDGMGWVAWDGGLVSDRKENPIVVLWENVGNDEKAVTCRRQWRFRRWVRVVRSSILYVACMYVYM